MTAIAQPIGRARRRRRRTHCPVEQQRVSVVDRLAPFAPGRLDCRPGADAGEDVEGSVEDDVEEAGHAGEPRRYPFQAAQEPPQVEAQERKDRDQDGVQFVPPRRGLLGEILRVSDSQGGKEERPGDDRCDRGIQPQGCVSHGVKR